MVITCGAVVALPLPHETAMSLRPAAHGFDFSSPEYLEAEKKAVWILNLDHNVYDDIGGDATVVMAMIGLINERLGEGHPEEQERLADYSIQILTRLRMMQRWSFFEMKQALIQGDAGRFNELLRGFEAQAVELRDLLRRFNDYLHAHATALHTVSITIHDILQKNRRIIASLDFALRAVHDDIPRAPVDLVATVREVVGDLGMRGYNASNVTMHFVQPEIVVEANEHLLKVLLSDIILNCFRHCQEAGVTPALTVTVGVVNDTAMSTVEDNGPGINDGMLEEGRKFGRQKIYDLGATGANSSGIGMCSSYHIMAVHHGFIAAHNKMTGGARFALGFPYTAAARQEEGVAAEAVGRAS